MKLHDFVHFGIYQGLVKPILTFFFSKNLKSEISKIFEGPRALGKSFKNVTFSTFFDDIQNLKSLWSKGSTHKI